MDTISLQNWSDALAAVVSLILKMDIGSIIHQADRHFGLKPAVHPNKKAPVFTGAFSIDALFLSDPKSGSGTTGSGRTWGC